MTDHQRARAEARARVAAELGVTRPVEALFIAIYYGFTISPLYLPARAAQEDYDPNGQVVTEEECRSALIDCLAKGWLQVIDEPARAKIVEELRNGGVLGPIYGGPPEVGCVDLGAIGFPTAP